MNDVHAQNLVSYNIAIKICVQVFYIFSLSWIHWKSIIRPKLLQWSLVLAPIYHQPNRHNASKMYAKLVMHTKQIRDIPLYLKPSKLQCSKVTISQKLYLLMHMFPNIILCQTPILRVVIFYNLNASFSVPKHWLKVRMPKNIILAEDFVEKISYSQLFVMIEL